jgi:hypothetical protein
LPVLEAGLILDEVLCPVQHDKDSKAWAKLQSLVMQLRKCCNHPYLFPDAEPSFDGLTTGMALLCRSHLHPDYVQTLAHCTSRPTRMQVHMHVVVSAQATGVWTVQRAIGGT